MRRQFDPFQLIFLGIVLIYAFGLSAFGMENFDTGYIPSFSWRIVNGELPYVDFFYKGPPATFYLHALFMKILPETAQFYWIRATVYLLFALQVFFTVAGIFRLFPNIKTNKWAVMSLCFVASLLNFAPYPWPTTDGLLFASAAFYILSANTNPKHGPLLAIALLSLLSALTKQSFYGVPLLFLVWIYTVAGLKKAITFAVISGFFLCCFLVFISKTAGLHNYIAQTTGETHLFDLFFVGFHHYILIPVRWFAVLAVITIAIALYLLKTKRAGLLARACKTIALTFLLAAFIVFFFDAQFASRLWWDGCVFILAYASLKNYPFKSLLPLWVLLGIAWSASISLGYQFPVLFSTAMFGIIILFFEDMVLPKWHYTLMFVLTIAGLSHVWQPYREKPLPELTYALGSISPKLSGIHTNRENFEKYTELKSLFNQYRPNVAVAPDIPMAHYLFSNESPLPADWLLPTETGRKPILFETLLSQPGMHVLLEKSYLDGSDNGTGSPAAFSPIAWFVHTKMKKTAETQYFMIYNGLK